MYGHTGLYLEQALYQNDGRAQAVNSAFAQVAVPTEEWTK